MRAIICALMLLCSFKLRADTPSEFTCAYQLEKDIYDYAYQQLVVTPNDSHGDVNAIIADFDPWFMRTEQLPSDGIEYLYINALLNRMLFNAVRHIDGDLGVTYWRQSFDFARRATQKNSTCANVYALFGAITGQSFTVIGSGGIAYVELTDRMVRRALDLDKNNALAWETQGFTFLFTPQGYGGDTKKAVKAFKKATEDTHDFIRLWAQVWLSVAYFENGRGEQARNLISRTLSEAPHVPYIRFAHEKLYNNKNPLLQSFTLE